MPIFSKRPTTTVRPTIPVVDPAIEEEIVARQLLIDEHHQKTREVDILKKKADLLRIRFDLLKDSYTLAMTEFWPCPIYNEMDKMLKKCVTIEEPERGQSEKGQSERVSRGPIVEVLERLSRQSTIARDMAARENSYQVMLTQELRLKIASLETTLDDLKHQIQVDEDRLNQLTTDYEKALTLCPLLRYFRFKAIIKKAIGIA